MANASLTTRDRAAWAVGAIALPLVVVVLASADRDGGEITSSHRTHDASVWRQLLP
jgi:hypothetical protein